VQEKAKEVFERYLELENIFNIENDQQYFKYPYPVYNLEDAEQAAIALRKDWNLGYDPIPDVVKMLEDKGYKVVEIDAPAAFDGFKADIGEYKVIVLRKTDTNDDIVRKRFTALHELAHHSLIIPENLNEKDEEKICHAFASAILYPAEMAFKEMDKERFHFYQNELVLIKESWGISFPAIFSRALQLGIINQNVYKRFNIGYRTRKYHELNNEPGRFLGKEKPVKIERLVFIALAKEILTLNEAAYFAGISSWKLRSQITSMV
jgi:Zn-dependent peptidase ImmA (M78 family)